MVWCALVLRTHPANSDTSNRIPKRSGTDVTGQSGVGVDPYKLHTTPQLMGPTWADGAQEVWFDLARTGRACRIEIHIA